MDNTEVLPIRRGLDVQDILQLLRAYGKGIALITVCGALLAFAWSLTQPKIYESTASGLVVARVEADVDSSLSGDTLAKSKAITYQALAESRSVAERTINGLQLENSPEDLLEQIEAAATLESVELRVTAESSTAQGAVDLANAWVGALADEVRAVEQDAQATANAPAAVAVRPLGNASIPEGPASPDLSRDTLLGGIAGLIAGGVYGVIRYRLDKRLRSKDMIAGELGLPVLGTLPVDERLETSQRLVAAENLSSLESGGVFPEAVRELRTNLNFVNVDHPPRVIVVTSPRTAEGKSTIAAHLAVAEALAGRDVVIVDGDLRAPALAEAFDGTDHPGLTHVLAGSHDLTTALQPWPQLPNLRILGAGVIPPNPTELLGSDAMRHVLRTLADDALVLVDAPPLLDFADASILTASADGALIVAAAGRTTTDELLDAVSKVENVRGEVLGIVLNRVPTVIHQPRRPLRAGDRQLVDTYSHKQVDSSAAAEEGTEEAAPVPDPPNGKLTGNRSPSGWDHSDIRWDRESSKRH